MLYCMVEIDLNGVIFSDDTEIVYKKIKCPCCRTLNWKYYYSMFISVEIGYGDMLGYEGKTKVYNIFDTNWNLAHNE